MYIFLKLFARFVKPKICENIHAGLADHFWYHLELQGTQFNQIRQTILCFLLFDPSKYEQTTLISQSRKLVFHQVGQIWSYRTLVKAFESSPRDLAIEKGLKCVAN